MTDELAFTGERFVPGAAGEIGYEHWHRYHFAARLVSGKRVLDVACGEGYGSALLARRAAQVVGVDVAEEAVRHARIAYAARANVAFQQADCTALPFPAASFDAVVSFETIEHIAAQEAFLDEVRRVLRLDGLLVLSCPNKAEYADRRGLANPYHVRELYRDELAALLAPRFAHLAWYGQQPSFFSVIWPEVGNAAGEIFEIADAAPAEASAGHTRPLYLLALASAEASAVASLPAYVSVLADRDEWVHRDYEKVTASLHAAHERGNALEAQVAAWQGHHAEAVHQRDLLVAERAALVRERDALAAELEGEIAKLRDTIGTLQGTVAARDASVAAAEAWRVKLEGDIAALRRELEARTDWRWWAARLLRRPPPTRA